MVGVVNVGKNIMDVRKSVQLMPYSRVILTVDEDLEFVAGNDSGQTLEVECPWGTQQMANDILARVRGYQYQPYTATTAIVEPSAEIGDAVQSNGVYGGLYKQDLTFGSTFYSDYSAPANEQIDNEYKYESKTERTIKRNKAWAKTEFTITNGLIASEVSQRQADSTEFRAQFEQTATQIAAKVSQTGGNNQSFGWSLISSGFGLYSGNKRVFWCNSSGIEVDGTITARSGYIGDGSTGFKIGSKAITNGKTSRDETTNDGIYLGTDGISLGKGVFKVTNGGALTATNATLTGTVTAKSGRIGADASGANGFTIETNKLYNGTNTVSSTNKGVYLGTDGIRVYKDATNYFTVNTTTGKITYCGGMNGRDDTTNKTGTYIGDTGIALGGGTFKVTNTGALTATNATLTGAITAKSGRIGAKSDGTGGFEIACTSAGTGSIKNGMTSLTDATNDGIYIGTDGISLGKGVFKVTSDGTLTASPSGGTIGGNGGFTIGTKSIYNGMTSLADTTNNGVYIGTDGIALGKGVFKVTNAGVLTATNATLTGAITAKSGRIGAKSDGTGGFEIDCTSAGVGRIMNGMTGLNDTANDGVYIGTNGIALGKGNFKVTSDGKLTAKSGTIEGNLIVEGTITEKKLGDKAVTSGKLGDKAVSTGKINDNAVTYGKCSKKGTTSSVQDSLDAGNTASSSLSSLMAGGLMASELFTKKLFVMSSGGARWLAEWKVATINGTTITYLGR